MGNNATFTEFEDQVIRLYDKGVLDQQTLSEIMEKYRGTDIDTGGMVGTLSKDGLDVEEIVLKTFSGDYPKYPAGLPKDHTKWNNEQEATHTEWEDARWKAFNALRQRFGWR